MPKGGLPTGGPAVKVGVYRNQWIPAGAFQPRETNGAEPVTEEYATEDINVDMYLFDGAVEEAIQLQIAFPDEWDKGTIKAKAYWDAVVGASGGDGVVWGVRARAVNDGDDIDAALGTEVLVTDTLQAVGKEHITDPTGPVTVGGTPQIGSMTLLQVSRKPGEVADDMTEDAKFLGLMIQYKERSDADPVAW